jgi:23S rRNA A1618 N6-methylase RlmF
MITPGGEEAFVSRMVSESITLGERCRYVLSFLPFFSYHLVSPALPRVLPQVVHIHARQAIIPDGSRDAPSRPLGTL